MKNELNVLLVDDESNILSWLSSVIKGVNGDAKILTSSNARDAIKTYKQKKIDITFLDIELCSDKNKNGIYCLEEIKKLNNDAFVVIISGLGTADNVKLALKAGAKGFIVKPCNANKVAEALDNYMKIKNATSS